MNDGKIGNKRKIVSLKKYRQLEKELASHIGDDTFFTVLDELNNVCTAGDILFRPFRRAHFAFSARIGAPVENGFHRMKNGYCDDDVWNFENWLLDMIPKMLDRMRSECFYVPEPFRKAKMQEFRSAGTGLTVTDCDCAIVNEWSDVLDRMTEQFKEANRLYQSGGKSTAEFERRIKEAFALLTEFYVSSQPE